VGVEGNVVWQGVRGVANLDTGGPITTKTVFHIASVTKQFTALAVLLLEEAGELSTSDHLSEHVRGLPAWADTITLAELIHHTSGIPEYIDLLTLEGVGQQDPASHAVALRAIAAVQELEFKPGSTWKYSNSNYLLLGEVVRSVSGEGLPAYLDKWVFSRLDLDMVMDSLGAIPGKAVPYRRTASGFEKDKTLLKWELIGAGGIQSTPTELVRWADNYRTGKVGGPAILRAQLTGGVPVTPDASTNDSPGLYVAGMIKSPEGHLIHGGSAGAFRTWFGVQSDRRTSLAIACNMAELNMDDFAQTLIEIWT
jgi:CubicO group peptidase (beta-lactamase class C family)